MAGNLKVSCLTHTEIADDGTSCRLHLDTTEGDGVALEVSLESLASLVMTLPSLLDAVLRRRFRDDTMRYVFPLSAWKVERASDGTNAIITLSTDGGFAVSFFSDERRIVQMAELISDYELEADPGGLCVH